jgi:hypothetical protein
LAFCRLPFRIPTALSKRSEEDPGQICNFEWETVRWKATILTQNW